MKQTLEQGLSMLSTQVCPQAVDRLLKFSEMLLEKNKVMNLTAVTEPMGSCHTAFSGLCGADAAHDFRGKGARCGHRRRISRIAAGNFMSGE